MDRTWQLWCCFLLPLTACDLRAADEPPKIKVLAETTRFGPDNDDLPAVGVVIRNAQELADVIHFGQTPAQALEYATKGFGVPVDFAKHTIVSIAFRSKRPNVKVEIENLSVVDKKLRVRWRANSEPDVGRTSKSFIRAWLIEKYDDEIVFTPDFPTVKKEFVPRVPIWKTTPIAWGDTKIWSRQQQFIIAEKKTEPAFVALRSSREYAEFIGSYDYEKSMQELAKLLHVEFVNFDKQMLLFVYPGQQTGTGHHTDVLSIAKNGNVLLVKWNLVARSAGREGSTGVSRRGEVLLIERFDGEVKFERASAEPLMIPSEPTALAQSPFTIVKQALLFRKTDHPGDRLPFEQVARNYTELARLLKVDLRDVYPAAEAIFQAGPIDFNKQMVVAASPGTIMGDKFESTVSFEISKINLPTGKPTESVCVLYKLRSLANSDTNIETHPAVLALVSRYDGHVSHGVELKLGPIDLAPGMGRMPIVARGQFSHPDANSKHGLQTVVKNVKDLAQVIAKGDEAKSLQIVQTALGDHKIDFTRHSLVLLSHGSSGSRLDIDAIETYTLGINTKSQTAQTLRDSLRIRDGIVRVHWQIRDHGPAKITEHAVLVLLVPKSNHEYQFEAAVLQKKD